MLFRSVDFASLRTGFSRNLPFGLLIAIVLLAEIVIAVAARGEGPALVQAASAPVINPVPNIEVLGTALYTRYLLPFELAGLVLLVAMIGAIVLTHRSRGDARGQNIGKQIRRRPEDAVRNEQPAVGEGMTL